MNDRNDMNKKTFRLKLQKLAIFAGVFATALCISSALWAQTNSKGEEFFIISSVNFQNHQIVLMRPTQLTVVATFGPQTAVAGENGEKLTVKDLKAGDTIWAVVRTPKKGMASVLRINEGAMTQPELHKLYLKYPANTTPVPVAPIKPAPQTGLAQPQTPTAPGVKADPLHPNPMLHGMRRPEHIRMHPHGPGDSHHTES
jgi:hypothetical protein